MQVVAEDGVRLSVRWEGSGESGTIMVLPDWLQSGLAFEEVAGALVAQGYRVVRPDPRGTGWSDRPEAGYGLARDAADAAVVVEQVGARSVTMVGVGYGALVAMTMARDTPHLLQRVVLVAPPVEVSGGRVHLEALSGLIEDSRQIRDFLESGVAKMMPPAIAAKLSRDMARTTAAAGRSQLHAMASADWARLSREVSCPVRMATGELDWWGGPQKIRERIGRPLHVWRDVGRQPMWEAPDEVLAFIVETENPVEPDLALHEPGAPEMPTDSDAVAADPPMGPDFPDR
jgi:pimeloyl-ACP methyl ester carboxylesterase